MENNIFNEIPDDSLDNQIEMIVHDAHGYCAVAGKGYYFVDPHNGSKRQMAFADSFFGLSDQIGKVGKYETV